MKLPWRLLEAEGKSMEVDGSRRKSLNIAGYCGSFRKFMDAGGSNGSWWTLVKAEEIFPKLVEVGGNSWKRVEVYRGMWKLPPNVVVEVSVILS